MRSWSFAKGHGTRNDFVIVADRHGLVPVTEEDVRFLCDRRAGIGGDGLLRVTMASSIPEWEGPGDVWFMDYRNADGSIAEMCGNGLRVFARYLMENNLVPVTEHFDVGTRAGLRRIWPQLDGSIRTAMGRVGLAPEPVPVTTGETSWQATKVDVGNPHAVVLLDPSDELAELDLSKAPSVCAEDYPHGTNVEFVQARGERHVAMRVHERGAGETMSCGTGTVAAAAAYCRAQGLADGQVRVDVLGGTVVVGLADGEATLTGPAVLVASGEVLLPDSL